LEDNSNQWSLPKKEKKKWLSLLSLYAKLQRAWL
jgi:hypothetical protein